MQNNLLNQIIILISIIVLFCLFRGVNQNEAIYVKSKLNQKEYFVQNTPDKEDSAHILSVIDVKITTLKKHLQENIGKYPEYKIYINQFVTKSKNLILYESKPGSKYTSYTINKGEEMVICLRSKNGKLHDINIITYVVLHELSHIACPEIDHTELFKRIFKFFIETAVTLGIYENINYNINPADYCGMVIRENLVKN